MVLENAIASKFYPYSLRRALPKGEKPTRFHQVLAPQSQAKTPQP
jgi:hypothetical protein